jgi:hypothetical protein
MSLREKVAQLVLDDISSSCDINPTEALRVSDIAIATMLAELETPSDEMVETCCFAYQWRPGDNHQRMAAAIQAIAAHMKGKT